MDRILATHTGSLIRPPELLAFLATKERGQQYDQEAYQTTLRTAVDHVVDKQVEAGIDIVDDGEMGKASWITYLYERVSGLEVRPITLEGASMLPPSRDRQAFPGAYAALDALDEAAVRESNAAASSALPDEEAAGAGVAWVCTGPLTYDRTARDRDIANFKAALANHDGVEGFLPVVAPASAYWLQNEHYPSEEEFVFALADALHEEYKGIVEAGLLLQVDDAVMMHEADTIMSRGESWDDYRRWVDLRVRALNHALEGLPEDRVRYHVCWGSWHGPHAFDPPLKDVVDLILAVNAGYYAMEQANARSRARVAGVGGGVTPRGQEAHPRRGDPPHQRGRASRAGGPEAGTAGERGRPRKRTRRNGLRLRTGESHPARASRNPVGEARGARGRGTAGFARVMGSRPPPRPSHGGRGLSDVRGEAHDISQGEERDHEGA